MGAESDDAKQGDKKIAILLRQVKIVGLPQPVVLEKMKARGTSNWLNFSTKVEHDFQANKFHGDELPNTIMLISNDIKTPSWTTLSRTIPLY